MIRKFGLKDNAFTETNFHTLVSIGSVALLNNIQTLDMQGSILFILRLP